MIGDVYYFFVLILFILNLGVLLNFSNYDRIFNWYYKFKKVTKKEPSRSDYKSKDFEFYNFYIVLELMNIFWILLGLVTKSWLAFICLLIFNLLISSIIKKTVDFYFLVKFLRLIKVSIVTLIMGFLFINHFHLHKNPIDLISCFF